MIRITKFLTGLLLVGVFCALNGCDRINLLRLSKSNVHYHCAYKNRTTGRYFYAENTSRVNAVHEAAEACRKDVVAWNCQFRYCNELHKPAG